jgi:hypothetical protein
MPVWMQQQNVHSGARPAVVSFSAWKNGFDLSQIPSSSPIQPSLHPTGSCWLHLPHMKMEQTKGESILLCQQSPDLCPCDSIANHILTNSIHSDFPLFSYLSTSSPSGYYTLTRCDFLKHCNEIWAPLGFPMITGQCFHIGGTTKLLMAGVPPHIIKMMRRWSSDTFLHYWCSLEIIAPLYAEFMGSST